MKEITDESKNSSDESSKEAELTRKEQIEKKRMIRKGKNNISIVNHIHHIDVKTIDTSKLSRQEKAVVQKVKNREAAQKSRDIHKQYVLNLEQEINELKNEMAKQICQKCRSELSSMDSIEDVELPEAPWQHPSRTFDQEQSPFVRIESSQENSLYYNFLCAFAICAVVLCCAASAPLQTNTTMSALPSSQRSLMEVPNDLAMLNTNVSAQTKLDQNHSNHLMKNTTYKLDNLIHKKEDKNELVSIFEQSTMDNECFKSLIRSNSEKKFQLHKVKDLSEYRRVKNELQEVHDTMMCSQPKLYRDRRSTNIFSRFIEVVVSGAQILDTYTGMVPQMIQLEGIYRLSAEVTKIERITDHNCLA